MGWRDLFALVIAVGLVVSGGTAAQAQQHSPAAQHDASVHDGEIGTATWYGEDFDGRTTADGERFDMYGLTAAHAGLPFRSLVEVTNLRNGRRIIVRVTDRRATGPGEVIVLSKAAAVSLGFAQAGATDVRVRVVTATVGAPGDGEAGGGWRQAASR